MRYIDADALYEKLYPLDLVDKRLYTINAKAVADAIAKTPTADVVPRSKVEELKKDRYQILPDGRIELIPRTDIDAVKADVAREIFEEIDEYAERQIESLNIAEKLDSSGADFFGGGKQAFVLLLDRLAELKKKYTEGDV